MSNDIQGGIINIETNTEVLSLEINIIQDQSKYQGPNIDRCGIPLPTKCHESQQFDSMTKRPKRTEIT